MRIVQINSYSNGSTGHIANSIHKELLSQGHESLFAYGNGPDIGQGGYRIGNRFDCFVHTVVTLITGLHGYSSVLSTYRLIKRIEEFKPDIIHLHNLHGSYLNLRVLFGYLKKSKIETVITLHDCWLYTGKCYHYYEAKCDRYLHSCGNCTQLSMYPKSYYFDRTKKMLRDKKKWIGQLDHLHVITISDWSQGQAEETFLGEYPIHTIKNGINPGFGQTCEVDSALSAMVGDRFIILGVASSWNAHKGIYDFIKLAQMLSEDEVIVLVGQISEEIELPDNIISAGSKQSVEALALIYNTAGVYVNMSTEETFGLVTAEAMACGAPCIVYGATACPEMIEGGKNGYIAAPHDMSQVYAHIQSVKNTASFDRTEISRKAREKYSARRMVSEYLTAYRGILNENHK